MFQNIKVDIIYYKTNTDFEMEFNLSGCCRMRLLTDKAPDRKILVSQLARAVSRSRIIIIAGSLFGEEGIIKTSAAAIGKSVDIVDNKQFGIESDDEIEIISDAVPLVSEDGIFGGCIIEQGPQTLILLSDNKALRKNIMQSLIHSYIKEVCAAEMVEKSEEYEDEEITLEKETSEDNGLETEEESGEEEIETELIIDEGNEEHLPEINENPSDELIIEGATESGDELISAEKDFYDENKKLSDAIVFEDDDYLDEAIKREEEISREESVGADDFVFEPEYFNLRKGKRMTMEYSYTGTDADAYITGEEYDEENPTPIFIGRGINVPIVIISVLLLIIVGIVCYCIFLAPSEGGTTTAEYLDEIFSTLFG